MGCINMKQSYAESSFIFKALSDETRLRALHMLSSGELCACEILESFHITQPTLSYHMNILCDSGLVSARRDGAWVKYSLNKEKLQAIRDFINDVVGAD
jgi:ArsR family transcriptional regulator